MKKFTFLLPLLCLALTHCSHGKKLKTEENKVSKGGIVSLSASAIKDRKSKYELDFSIANDTDQPIVIMANDLKCFKGDVAGEINFSFLKKGSLKIEFRKNETKKLRLVCSLGEKSSGTPRIVVANVFGASKGDSKEASKALVENLEWTLPTAGK